MEFRKGELRDLDALDDLFQQAIAGMHARGNDQWDEHYPNRSTLESDLEIGQMFVAFEGDTCIGATVLNEQQDPEYASIPWTETEGPQLVIHRLAINPNIQGKGYGTEFLNHCNAWAVEHGYRSIRLDTYGANDSAMRFYEKNGYTCLGAIYFARRPKPFYCYEKLLP